MNKNKGFTLIELLVVIAIIGILSSVVLASLSTARNKGKDAAVISQLAQMRSQAELYTGTRAAVALAPCPASGSATLFGTANNGLGTLIAAVGTSGGTAAQCVDDGTNWAVSATLLDGATTYCVNSAGQSKRASAAGAGGVCS